VAFIQAINECTPPKVRESITNVEFLPAAWFDNIQFAARWPQRDVTSESGSGNNQQAVVYQVLNGLS